MSVQFWNKWTNSNLKMWTLLDSFETLKIENEKEDNWKFQNLNIWKFENMKTRHFPNLNFESLKILIFENVKTDNFTILDFENLNK